MSDVHGNEPQANPVVLLVEDHPEVRHMLSRGLRRARIDVIEAETAQEARAVLERGGVDALVTDIRLPGRNNGAELGNWARFRFPSLPTVFITGLSAQELPEDLVLDGFSSFLSKPFGIRLLIDRVQALMARPGLVAAG